MQQRTTMKPASRSRRRTASAATARRAPEPEAETTENVPPASRRAGIQAPKRIPLMALSFIIVLTIPIEFSFYLGSLLMTPTRVFFTLIALPVIAQFFLRVKLRSYDYVFIGFVLWTVTAQLLKRSFGPGLEAAGSTLLETLVVYALARAYMRSHSDFVILFRTLFWIVAVLGLLAIPEAVFKTRFLHDAVRSITGFYYYISADERFNLLRAASTFEHPILFGLFSASIITYTWYLSKTTGSGILRVAVVLVASFSSLSSAAYIAALAQCILIAMERISRGIKWRVQLILGGLASVYVFLEIASNRGAFGIMAAYLTFNPSTAYYRALQWQYVQDDVWRSPWFGIIPYTWTRPFWMTDSIDNHWVFQSLRGGVPSVILLIATILLIIRRMFRADTEAGDIHSRLRLSWTFAILGLSIGAATVTFFGKMQPVFMFSIGLGATLLDLAPTGARGDKTAGERPARRRQPGNSRLS